MPFVVVLFPQTKAIPIILEHLATHYQTLQIWIGHNATRYPNLNGLPHALPYLFPEICLDFGNLQRFPRITVKFIIYIYIYIYIYYLKKKIDGNAR